ncbi:MAG: nitrate/nitrite transporter [Salinirussus sp.]
MSVVTSVRTEIRALVGNGKGRFLAPIALGWGLLLGTRVIFPVVLPYLRVDYGLSLSTAGLLVTVLWLGSAIGQLPSGILADRYTERSIMTLSPVSVALGIMIIVSSTSSIALFAGTAIIGMGISLYPVARITMLSKLYPDRIGSALGVTMATGDLGQSILPPIAGALAVGVAWQLGLGYVVPFMLLATIGLFFLLPRGQNTDSAVDEFSTDALRSVLGTLRHPTMLFMGLVMFLFIFIWQSFTAFFPTYLVEVKGISSTAASALFGLFFACGVVFKPLAGAAYDRVGMRLSLLLVLVGPLVGLVVLPAVGGLLALLGVTVLVSSMLGAGAVTQSFLSDAFPPDRRGTGLGAIRTAAATMGAIGPVVFGVLADSGLFDEAYLVLAAIMLAVILLTIRMPDATPHLE